MMSVSIHRMTRTFLGWVLTAALAASAPFAPPGEDPPPFRRDRLPVDTESMAALSRHLVVVSDHLPQATPNARRHITMALGLALALDPSNEAARNKLNDRLSGKTALKGADDDAHHTRSITQIHQALGWLAKPEAGPDAHALARCFLDLLIFVDPDHPLDAAISLPRVDDPWREWIPGVEAFRESPPADEPADEPSEAPPEREQTAMVPGIALREATVRVPLWSRADDEKSWKLASAEIRMAATHINPVNEDGEPITVPFALRLPDVELAESARGLARLLASRLESLHGPLPENVVISIHGRELEQSLASRRRESIGGAVFVLASSAFSGCPPVATVIGEIDASGDFVPPRNFWQILRSMETAPSTRVVIPSAASPYLTSLLAYEKPGFFLRHEVLLAENVADLLRFASSEQSVSEAPSPADPLSVTTRFREIASKRGNQDVGAYVANRFVRQRLVEIVQEAPHHASARMLAIQAAGERPTRLPANLLATEILLALQPIGSLTNETPDPIVPSYIERLDETYKSTRAAVDALDRYADTGEKHLIPRARDVANLMRNMHRSASSRRGENHEIRNAVDRARRDLRAAYEQVKEDLEAVSGLDSPS